MALIRRHRAGDATALAELCERYYDRICRLVRIELHGFPVPGREVEDVVQDVFLRVLEGLDGYEERTDARWINWVATLARNSIRNGRRVEAAVKRGGRMRRSSLDTESGRRLDLAAQISSVASRVSRNLEAERLDACVPRLRDDQRRAVVLREYEGHDWAEIAVELDRSVEACQQLHLRARVELGRLLRQA